MTYKVIEVMFFACTDPIMGENLTWEEAKELQKQCDKENQDTTYRWYEIKEE